MLEITEIILNFSHFSDEKILVQKMFDQYNIYKQLSQEEDDEWLLQSVAESETE